MNVWHSQGKQTSEAKNDCFVLRYCNCVHCKYRSDLQSISEPVTVCKADPISDLTAEPVFEPTLEPTSEPIDEPFLNLYLSLY